jgi:pimeloyl-ACP methyl ester carboxylesterase
MPQPLQTQRSLGRATLPWLAMLLSLALSATATPRFRLVFPFQLYRSGEVSPCLGELEADLSQSLDLYVVVRHRDAQGKVVAQCARPDGTLVPTLAAYRTGTTLRRGQNPFGNLRQPVIDTGVKQAVTWTVYSLPAGTAVPNSAVLVHGGATVPVPTMVPVVSSAYSNPWLRFAFVQASGIQGRMRLRAEISDEGKRFRCVVDDSDLSDFWQLPGPKLILIAGLGCSARAWVGDPDLFVLNGSIDYRRRGILSDPDLLKHYRHVAFFEYPSAGDLGGEEIAGRLRAAMRHARPEDRIDMIGHSMGGMVARHFIEVDGGHRVVDRAVFLQTPLNGLSNGVHDELAHVVPTGLLSGALAQVSPLSKMLKGSPYYERLNGPWLRHEPPTSPHGFGTCRYYCVAGGVYGSGRDPRRIDGWFDQQSDAFPTEIKATSALWLPLGGGPFAAIDPTGEHELLTVSRSKEQDLYVGHVSFIFFMADEQRNGSARWIASRLWPTP